MCENKNVHNAICSLGYTDAYKVSCDKVRAIWSMLLAHFGNIVYTLFTLSQRATQDIKNYSD